MSAKKLAIVTPVYNRACELKNLYESLKTQTVDDFVWYLVDDGSTDNSWSVIQDIANLAHFQVKCFHKNNGGKHTALNYVMKYINEELTFIVDSDDSLPDDSVDTILSSFNSISDAFGLCGISFLREMSNSPRQDYFPVDGLRGSYMDVRVNGEVVGDKAEVYFTKCLLEEPFPEFDGERFYHEDGVWVRLSAKYEMVHLNKIVYKGEYLEGGLTNNGRQMKLGSPVGMCDRSAQFLGYPGRVILKERIKHAILWDVYSAIALSEGKELPCACPASALCTLLSPIAFVLRHKWIGSNLNKDQSVCLPSAGNSDARNSPKSN